MKKFPLFILLVAALIPVLTSCFKSDEPSSQNSDWAKANTTWYEEQAQLAEGGNKYYKTVTAPWDPAAEVLIHWYNDTTKTRGNLKPLYTSMVDVKYHLSLYDGTAVDSSYLSTSPADSLFRCRLNTGVIEGWAIAITQMHIGDSCRVIIPYNVGYGTSSAGDIKPYSTLSFRIKLVGIPAYER